MAWRLVPLYEEEEYLQAPPSLRFRLYPGVTAYGEGAPLSTGRDLPDELLNSTYVFLGGHVHETTDPAIRDLWLASGFEVETF
jgi:hypothetical protein